MISILNSDTRWCWGECIWVPWPHWPVCMRPTIKPLNAEKYVFKIDRKIGTKYQHSPFYKGTLLWNDLSADIQFSRDIFEFKKLIARKYMIYENLLETNV